MSLKGAKQTTTPILSNPSSNHGQNGSAQGLEVGPSEISSQYKVTKPKWTAKRTRGQFSFSTGSDDSRDQRRPPVSTSSKTSAALANALIQYELSVGDAANSAVKLAAKSEQQPSCVRTGTDDETTESLSCLHTNFAGSPPSYHTSPTSITDIDMIDGVESGDASALCNPVVTQAGTVDVAGAATVPRSFDFLDLTVLSEDSDRDMTHDSPTTKAETTAAHNVPLALSEAADSANVHSSGTTPAPTTKKESFATPPKTCSKFLVHASEGREVIYISSDESDGEGIDAGSSTQRLTLEEPVTDIPVSEPRLLSVEDDRHEEEAQDVIVIATNKGSSDKGTVAAVDTVDKVIADKGTVATVATVDKVNADKASAARARCAKARAARARYLKERRAKPNTALPSIARGSTAKSTTKKSSAAKSSTKRPSAQDESSEDNVPLAVLQRGRLKKCRPSCHDKQPKLNVVKRPTISSRIRAMIRTDPINFNSSSFDAQIYAQSRMRPPPGVIVPRRALKSMAPAQDPRVFVSANPAIHGMVVRSSKWWDDKVHEICARSNRKKWFGKVAQRMRWLYEQQLEKVPKGQESRRSAGRQVRQDPQPASCQRIMDFGDVPENQLPPDVLSNPAWVKACEWLRNVREVDAVGKRKV